jgi:hypothetical protein
MHNITDLMKSKYLSKIRKICQTKQIAAESKKMKHFTEFIQQVLKVLMMIQFSIKIGLSQVLPPPGLVA